MKQLRRCTISILMVGMLIFVSAASAGILFVGADVEDFANVLPDRLGKLTTSGANVNSSLIINTNYFINGMADRNGNLIAGTPNKNVLNTVDYDGNLLSTINAQIPNNNCCNEEMLFVGPTFYHANWQSTNNGIGGIRELDPNTGNLITFSPMEQVVGMALVGNQIWISKWSPKQVGTWDPGTNIFTPVFNTPNNAGALAYDPVDNVLWVGMSGGIIIPSDLFGNALGPAVQPFGPIGQTIDGLAFQRRLHTGILLGFTTVQLDSSRTYAKTSEDTVGWVCSATRHSTLSGFLATNPTYLRQSYHLRICPMLSLSRRH
ncbi:hypothetical protein HYR99_31370 [Candidatus Poribacteria bacterium]|nr:hypothetical protein [Candidatus Poribacteria bacterium]